MVTILIEWMDERLAKRTGEVGGERATVEWWMARFVEETSFVDSVI
jgi:hypothetical protein